MRIKVNKCSASLSNTWYSHYVGETFDVVREESDVYWVRESDPVYRALNWILKEDVEVVS